MREFLLIALIIVDVLLWVFIVVFLVRIAFSWFRVGRWRQPARTIYTLTDPLMDQIARIRFLRVGMIDFSPTVVILLILLLKDMLLPWLRHLVMT